MRRRGEVRWRRALALVAIYLFIYVVSFTIYFFLLINWHLTIYSYTLEYLLQNPSIALQTVLMEMTRSPSSLFIIVLCSFILGFATDVLLARLAHAVPPDLSHEIINSGSVGS